MALTDLQFSPSGKTLVDLFHARVALTPAQSAACYHNKSVLQTASWKQVAESAEHLGSVLADHVARIDHVYAVEMIDAFNPASTENTRNAVVGIFLPTGFSWLLTDIACLCRGWTSAVYHAAWQLSDLSHALSIHAPDVIVCTHESSSLVQEALREAELRVPLVCIEEDGHVAESQPSSQMSSATLPSAVKRGKAAKPEAGTAATIVFTSGTGGNAKAVELTHGALLDVAWHAYHQLGFDGRGAHTLHWLPLSHMFGRIGIYIDWIAGSTGYFTRGIDRLADDLSLARPDVLFAVPQVLGRLRKRIESGVQARPLVSRVMFRLLCATGALLSLLPSAPRLRMQAWLRKNVFAAVHRPLGGRLAAVIVGGAPVDENEKRYFESLGIAVREGFGMTETAGVAAVQSLRGRSTGCGKFLSGFQACISDNGELLLRGPAMLSRYLNGNAYDASGWFHSGDLAEITKSGSLRITGRLKDLIIPLSGENISPARLEALICRHDWIDDACVFGDKRPCLGVVMALSASGKKAADEEGAAHVERQLVEYLAALNTSLPKYEQLRAYVIAENNFTVAHGELTVTNKKKRTVITARYAKAIDAAYARLQTTR